MIYFCKGLPGFLNVRGRNDQNVGSQDGLGVAEVIQKRSSERIFVSNGRILKANVSLGPTRVKLFQL